MACMAERSVPGLLHMPGFACMHMRWVVWNMFVPQYRGVVGRPSAVGGVVAVHAAVVSDARRLARHVVRRVAVSHGYLPL